MKKNNRAADDQPIDLMAHAVREVEDFEGQPGDMLLIVRDGLPIVKTPVHGDHDEVPQDFLILIAIATVWLDPNWRAMMLATLRQAEKAGMLKDIIHGQRRN